jgi:hypothetical protein
MVFGLLFLLGQKAKLWDDSSDAGLFSVPINAGIGLVAALTFMVRLLSLFPSFNRLFVSRDTRYLRRPAKANPAATPSILTSLSFR